MFTAQTVIVPPEGPKDAPLAIVGEAPGSHETRMRRPFVGMAGQLLDECMKNAGINRRQVYITNVVKEQPPGNDISKFITFGRGGIVHTTDTYDVYVHSLKDELEGISANCIVACGGVALYALTGLQQISKRRGSIYESTLLPGRKVLAMTHPAAALRAYLLKYTIILDLKRARVQSTFPEVKRVERNLIINPSYEHIMSFLEALIQEDYTTLDLEVYNHEISCLSMGCRNLGFMCIPFIGRDGDIFSVEQETAIWGRIALICTDRNITKIGHNIATFDSTFLYRKMGIITRPYEDTLIAQGILYPDLPKGLDFCTSAYTEEPYYKDEGKDWNNFAYVTSDDFARYNAKDSAVLPDIWDRQKELLHIQGNWEAYCRERDLGEPLTGIVEKGIRVDIEGLKKATEKAEQEITDLQKKLDEVAGRPLNPNSSKQMAEYFYEQCGYKPYMDTKTHRPTTNEKALKRLSRKGAEAASIVIKLRGLKKLKGTYLEMKFDEDNRLRCSFKLPGTSSGRLASSQTIFGTGGNTQNLPNEFKQYVLVDEGHLGYQIDLSQAENRDVANIAPDARMLDAFANGIDMHSNTAALIFDCSIEGVSTEAGSSGIGTYSQRDIGKRANHGLNYDLGYKTFALYLEIPESAARFIVERYHQAYPGVRQYHAWVRAQLSKNRTLSNSFGRKRLFLDRWGDELFKEAYSFHPQSTIAEKLNIDGVCYVYYKLEEKEYVTLLNQVHDSIWFQIPLTLPLEEHAYIVHKIKTQLQTPITWRTRTYSIPADVEVTEGNFGKYKVSGYKMDQDSGYWTPLGNIKGLRKVKGTTPEEIYETLKKIVGD